MKEIKIPKKSGGFRTIVIPSREQKKTLRNAIPELQRRINELLHEDVIHGFRELRSPVTNAAQHVGYRFTVSFDLKDFFDHVTEAPSKSMLYNGRAAQGLPTSPLLANLAAAKLDVSLKFQELLPGVSFPLPFVYTRYADDLTFSTNGTQTVRWIMDHVPDLCHARGFPVNPSKTRLQDAKYGRRHITGIAVDDKLHPTRATKRKLRAAVHNAKTGKVKHFPLRQWIRYVRTCKLRGQTPMPKDDWLQRWLHKRVRGIQEWMALKWPSKGIRSALRICETIKDPGEMLERMAQRESIRCANERQD